MSAKSVALPGYGAALTPEEFQHTEHLLSLFEKHLVGTRANAKKTVRLASATVRAFLKHVGLPPWRLVGEDLDNFLAYKVEKANIGLSRQSAYVTYLRAFQNYIIESRGLSNEIHRKFGVQPQRFVTSENAIPIKRKNKHRKKVPRALSSKECQRILQEFDAAIGQAKATDSKAFNTLRRDKTMNVVMMLTGLRVDEVVTLRTSNFQPDLNHPQFGDYALLTVIKGKGRKMRVVRLFNPLIKEVMDWYLDEVRPELLSKDMQDPNLLFPSERGGILCAEQVRRTLARMASNAGIPDRVTPHMLRHTYATQMAPIIGPEALRNQLGHEHLSTTLGTYYHPDPERVGNEVQLGIDKLTQAIDALTKRHKR